MEHIDKYIYITIFIEYFEYSEPCQPVPCPPENSAGVPEVVQILVSAAEKQLTLENFEALAAARYGWRAAFWVTKPAPNP